MTSKELIIFDLDGTLALSKSSIDEEMALLLEKLLTKYKVIVVSGGKFKQFETQLIDHLRLSKENSVNFYIEPGSGSSMYKFVNDDTIEMYADVLNHEEKDKIMEALNYALDKANFHPVENTLGEIIEDRVSQITFSALGQNASLSEKKLWDPDHRKREEIIKYLNEKIPEFEVHMGGTTSIDVTKKGRDKAYGIRKASEYLGIPIEKILFVGDALYPGGNDEPAIKSGVECIQVKDIEDTKRVIKEILAEEA